MAVAVVVDDVDDGSVDRAVLVVLVAVLIPLPLLLPP